ncbi:ATP-grasp domain-containing protein [Streptomyces canus]|uniref:ATP-grasp domain-containing protein n=1 Tax=Streptomyces canus TaxID=58343 RepID=UPI0033B01819
MASDPPSILLLGTDRYVLRACEQRGVDAVVLCGPSSWDNGNVPVPKRFTQIFTEDLTSTEATLSALHRAGLGGHRFDAVQTSDEWAVVNAAVLAQLIGARGPDPLTALRFRDKRLQKEVAAAAGIPVARTAVIEDVHQLARSSPGSPGPDELLAPLGGFERAVAKPIAGSSTSHTFRLGDPADLLKVAARMRAEGSPRRTFLVEEFVEGDEWVVDGFVFDGELLFHSVGRYGEPCLTSISEQTPLWMYRFDPDTDAEVCQRAGDTARAVLSALGMRDGVFHMELFHDPESGRLALGEVAARRGGVLIQEEVAAKFNVSLGDSALMCALGIRPQIDVRTRPGTVGAAHLPGASGTLVSCPQADEICELPGVEFARIIKPYGSRLAAASSTGHRLGDILVTAPSPDELIARIEEARKWFSDRVVVAPDGAGLRELRDWQHRNWPGTEPRESSYTP